MEKWLQTQEPRNEVRLDEEVRRCFSSNSVKEIMRRLKNDRIKEKLDKMKHKDVIFKLMMEAEKSTFKRCLELELEAGNYILDK